MTCPKCKSVKVRFSWNSSKGSHNPGCLTCGHELDCSLSLSNPSPFNFFQHGTTTWYVEAAYEDIAEQLKAYKETSPKFWADKPKSAVLTLPDHIKVLESLVQWGRGQSALHIKDICKDAEEALGQAKSK
jgi:hypothetical protein